jgi:hypothetical protein
VTATQLYIVVSVELVLGLANLTATIALFLHLRNRVDRLLSARE